METWIVEFIEQFGYLAVFLLIALENIFPPIPSEIILTFAGFMITKSDLGYLGMVLFSTLGSYIGAIILYGLGYFLRPEKFERFLNLFKFNLEDVEKAEKWFNNKGSLTVFFCRFVPIIRSLISIPAGMSRMKMLPFSLYTVVGSLIWNCVLIYVGTVLGDHYGLISGYMDQYGLVVGIIVVIVAAAWLIMKFKKKKKDA